jgi:hypothetical protein
VRAAAFPHVGSPDRLLSCSWLELARPNASERNHAISAGQCLRRHSPFRAWVERGAYRPEWGSDGRPGLPKWANGIAFASGARFADTALKFVSCGDQTQKTLRGRLGRSQGRRWQSIKMTSVQCGSLRKRQHLAVRSFYQLLGDRVAPGATGTRAIAAATLAIQVCRRLTTGNFPFRPLAHNLCTPFSFERRGQRNVVRIKAARASLACGITFPTQFGCTSSARLWPTSGLAFKHKEAARRRPPCRSSAR